MANPIQYTPQFVPTDFNTLRDVLGMYRQDLAGRDQMFDQGAASRDNMLTELYSQETYDPDVLKSEVDRFSTKMDELVNRYGGDYGAAAKEIARLGTKESSNPLYQLNRRKVEQVKNLEQLMARNPNLMALKDPRKVKLGQNVATEDLQYEVADPADIQNAFKSIYGAYKDRVTQSGLVNAPGRPGVLQYSTTKGLTKEQIAQMQQDENTYSTILGQMPQLQKYMDNPEVATWFKNQVSQSLPGLEGGSQLDYMNDPSFVKGGKGDEFSSRTIPLAEVSSKLIERQYKPFDKVDELFDPAKVSEDPIRAARVKDEIKSRMLNPEFNPRADKDAVVLSALEQISGKDGIEAANELSRYTKPLPSSGHLASGAFMNVVNIAKGLIKGGMGIAAASTPTGLATSKVALDQSKDAFKQVDWETALTPIIGGAALQIGPFRDYLKEKRKVYDTYGVSQLDKQNRKKILSEVNNINSNIKSVGSKVLQENFGDYQQDFLDFNASTGYEELDKKSIAARERLDKLVGQGGQIAFSDFKILQTDGDEKFTNLEKLKKDPELYGKAQASVRISGVIIDDDYGPLYELETENNDGTLNYHIAVMDNPKKNKTLLPAFGENNIQVGVDKDKKPIVSNLANQYEEYEVKRALKQEFGNSLNNLPKYDEFDGSTLKEYSIFLENRNDVPYQQKLRAMEAIKRVMGLQDTSRIK